MKHVKVGTIYKDRSGDEHLCIAENTHPMLMLNLRTLEKAYYSRLGRYTFGQPGNLKDLILGEGEEIKIPKLEEGECYSTRDGDLVTIKEIHPTKIIGQLQSNHQEIIYLPCGSINLNQSSPKDIKPS